MAGCPNCGRRTLRTKDWVCEWCGYPLLYGNYKTIDKTYKELQEERAGAYGSEGPESEPDIKYEQETEPEPEPQPKTPPIWKLRKPPKPTYPKSQPEAAPEPEIRPEPRPIPRPANQPPPRPAAPAPVPAPKADAAPQPAPEITMPTRVEISPVNRPEPVLLPRADTALQPAPQAATPAPETLPRPAPPPPPRAEPQPEPLKVPSLESIVDGTVLSIDQIDALFRADNLGANAALKDKSLVIKGIVNKLFIRDHLDVRYMILTGARKGVWSARCSFEKESVGDMSRLTEGQAVALRSKYDGYSKNIIFKECTLVG